MKFLTAHIICLIYSDTYLNKGGTMATAHHDTVVVENERRPTYGLIALIVAIVLIILFFAFGGGSLFNGSHSTSGSGTSTGTNSSSSTTTSTPSTGQ